MDRAPARAARRSEHQVAPRRLVALAEQLEHAAALREVVVRLAGVRPSARATRRARAGTRPTRPASTRASMRAVDDVDPAARRPRVRPASSSASVATMWALMTSAGGARAGLGDGVGRGRGPRRGRRAAARAARRAGAATSRTSAASARRSRRSASRACRRSRSALLVGATDQVDLRQRVEDRARRLVEEQVAPHLERALQHRLGARERAEVDADLAERRERDGEAVARRKPLVQRHAPLGQRQRLVVAVAHHRDVGLVAATMASTSSACTAAGGLLGLAQRRQRLVVAAGLRERAARQRVHEREVAAIAHRVQRRGRLGEVLAHRRRRRRPACSSGPARSGRAPWRGRRGPISAWRTARWCRAMARD